MSRKRPGWRSQARTYKYLTDQLAREAAVGRRMTQYRREEFNNYPSGKIIAGLRWAIYTNLGLETHECYQFSSIPDLEKCIVAFMCTPGMAAIEVVTHTGGYQNMKVLRTWGREVTCR